jgi:hypothetical protein
MIDDPSIIDRLARDYRDGVWIGSVRRVFGPISEIDEETGDFDTRPPHFLIVNWRPLRRGQASLPRWPRKAMLVAPDATAAVRELLRDVPETDKLWLTEQEIDWGLVADIVMLSESQLRPYQMRGLQEFVERERELTLSSIRSLYRGSQEVPSQFKVSTPGFLPAR